MGDSNYIGNIRFLKLDDRYIDIYSIILHIFAMSKMFWIKNKSNKKLKDGGTKRQDN